MGWIIFLGIVLFFWLVANISVNLTVSYQDSLQISLRILFLKFFILPEKRKKAKILTASQYRRLLKKEESKKAKKNVQKRKKEKTKSSSSKSKMAGKRPSSESSEKDGEKKKMDLSAFLHFLPEMLKEFLKSFGKHLKIRTVRMKISVGSDDAAKTAMLYSAICQGVAYITQFLEEMTGYSVEQRKKIQIEADYLSSQTKADICFIFRLRIWHFFAMLLAAGTGFLKKKLASTNTK